MTDSARVTARKDTLGHGQYPWRTALRQCDTATTDAEASLDKESNKQNDENNNGDDDGQMMQCNYQTHSLDNMINTITIYEHFSLTTRGRLWLRGDRLGATSRRKTR